MSTPIIPETLHESLIKAMAEARQRRHEYITLEHLLLALTQEARAAEILAACGVDLKRLRQELNAYLDKNLEQLPETLHLEPEETLGFRRVLSRAVWHAQSAAQPQLESGDVLAALLEEPDSHARYLLEQQGITRLDVLNYISHGLSREDAVPTEMVDEDEETGERVKDPLAAFTTDLVELAASGKIDPLIGRTAELERTVQVLCRRLKNNPLLVGDAGVGKTAMVYGLATRIYEGQVPDMLKEVHVYALDMGLLLAGTKFRGQFEERVKGVLRALQDKPRSILFIDEIHTVVGAGATSGGSVDASSLLKPALANGELRCIGSTTHEEYKVMEKDRGLARRFQKIDITEPSVEETVQILTGLKPRFEEHHELSYTDAAIRAAAELAAKHINDRFLPDKAIDVLDEAGARQRIQPAETKKAVLGREEVEAVVAAMARVPAESVSGDDRTRLKHLDSMLRQYIFGQTDAIEAIVAAIRLSRAGLRLPDKPVGSFLFFGPTGVGKTELARVLSRSLAVELLRYDMSEYSEKHTVSRLIGAPPGYVGFDQGGLLTDAVRRHPYSVVLLDEIEKAHPDLFNILLQVMDHATLTDNTGRRADFRNVILIMTTNAGARELTAQPMGFAPSTAGDPAKKPLERLFSPEFRNRLDAVVRFDTLATETIKQIVDKQINELRAALRPKNITLELSEAARAWLAEHGYHKDFGARPMSRLIDDKLRKPLAEAMLFGDLADGGGTAWVDVADKEISLTYRQAGKTEDQALP
ncbi:MAG: ATP-dependent Clp protease ATP-binding subunit ClpA [Anaerolineales bacterium]|nr:ATP-dependent Clp protease ATP-binding subunit ClpA [Anaerolineales bacterium]